MLLNCITLMSYIAGASAQVFLSLRKKPAKKFICGMTFLAITLHAFLLYRWIDLKIGQNLTEFNLLSLAIWVIACILFFLSFRNQMAYLSVLIFPLAAVSIFLASSFPSHHIIHTATEPKQFAHILLSILTFSVLALAGIQAITLAIQDKVLRRKYFRISELLPPIETMEKLLFRTILAGFILLSTVLVTSVNFFYHQLFNQFLEKTLLTFIAWLVFGLLLLNHYYLGWRGKKAIYWTLSGVMLLSTIYFSSMIIMELMP